VNWDVSIALRCALSRVGSDATMHDSFPVTILLSTSPSSAYRKRCCKDRPIRAIFPRSFSSLGTDRAHTFQNFKRSCTMLYAKPWEHSSAVATLSIFILLSARINSSTRCTIASVATKTRRLSNVLERSCRPSCDLLYVSNIAFQEDTNS
jgi:hypothetical protein